MKRYKTIKIILIFMAVFLWISLLPAETTLKTKEDFKQMHKILKKYTDYNSKQIATIDSLCQDPYIKRGDLEGMALTVIGFKKKLHRSIPFALLKVNFQEIIFRNEKGIDYELGKAAKLFQKENPEFRVFPEPPVPKEEKDKNYTRKVEINSDGTSTVTFYPQKKEKEPKKVAERKKLNKEKLPVPVSVQKSTFTSQKTTPETPELPSVVPPISSHLDSSNKVKFELYVTNITGSGRSRTFDCEITNLGEIETHNTWVRFELLSKKGKSDKIKVNGQDSIILGTIKSGQRMNQKIKLSVGVLDGIKNLLNPRVQIRITIHSDELSETFLISQTEETTEEKIISTFPTNNCSNSDFQIMLRYWNLNALLEVYPEIRTELDNPNGVKNDHDLLAAIQQSTEYLSILEANSDSLPKNLLEAVMLAESEGNDHCISPRGSRYGKGAFQIAEETAKELGLRDRTDVRASAEAAHTYLFRIQNIYLPATKKIFLQQGIYVPEMQNDIDYILAGWNAGPFKSWLPFKERWVAETKGFVASVKSFWRILDIIDQIDPNRERMFVTPVASQ